MKNQELYQVLVETYALYLKTQNYHWNIKGKQFHAIHVMLEEQYEELADAIDEIAERIVQTGDHVPATLYLFGSKTKMEQDTDELVDAEMINKLIEAQGIVKKAINVALKKAQKEEDEVTTDLLVQRLKVHDKANWMLSAMMERY
jgi:starvation-inducible DNA-binding protein